jgi:peptidoglycan/LPS O-acetylase OafA/YrhL
MKLLSLSEERLDLKNNSFDILRVFLAFLVITAHIISLFKDQLPRKQDIVTIVGNETLGIGGFAVYGFFVISGILITNSAIRSSSIWSYLKKRILRIYPAFWVCIFLIAFIFTPLFFVLNTGSLAGYWSQYLTSSIKYFFLNLTAYLAVLDINGFYGKYFNLSNADGSLWTLAYETRAYLLVALLMFFKVVKKSWTYIALFVFFTFTYIIAIYMPDIFLHGDVNKLHNFSMMSYFFIGGTALFYLNKISIDWKLFVLSIIGLFVSIYFNLVPILTPISIAYMTIFLGAKLPLRNFAKKYGDISYGMYLFGIPVQELLLSLGFEKYGFVVFEIVSVILAALVGYASYHLIEKRFIARKSITKKTI